MTSPCPACGLEITDASCADLTPGAAPRPPRPGDLAVCPACLAVLWVGLDGRVRIPTAAEWSRVEPELQGVLWEIRVARHRAHGAAEN